MTNVSTSIHQRRVAKRHTVAIAAIGLLFAVLAVPLIRIATTRFATLMAYTYPSDGLEGTLLSQAHLLWAGEPLYRPFELYRFVSAPYPPLHAIALGFADQFAGPHPFWSGRMVSLLAAIVVLVVVVVFVRATSRSWLAGAAAAVFVASAPPFVLWATRIKPDLFALMWTALGLLLAMIALGTRTNNQEPRSNTISGSRFLVVGSAFCFALAYFTKQTALMAPVAVGLALVSDDIRGWFVCRRSGMASWQPLQVRTIVYGATYLVLIAVPWLLLDLLTNGWFTFLVWVQHRGVLWTWQLMMRFVGLLADSWPMILISLGVVGLAWRNQRMLVPAWYVVLAPLTLFGAGETGANHNHLLETTLALAFAGGTVLGWSLCNLATRPVVAWLAPALMAVQLLLLYTPLSWYGDEMNPQDPPERYVAFIRSKPGEVLADNPGLLYLAEKPIRYDDPSSFGPDATHGLWDQSGLLDDIANRRFDAILVPFNTEKDTSDPTGRWTPEMIAAVREHYQLLYQDTIKVYVPK